jgi:uncharacterized membrane protein YbaN (DUF454 family)
VPAKALNAARRACGRPRGVCTAWRVAGHPLGYPGLMPSSTSDKPRQRGGASDGALGAPAPAPRGGWRDRVRSKPGLREAYRVGVFVVGLLFVVLGIALAALPGPLTIPPVLLGLYIWSTEFAWAHKLFESFRRKGEAAWDHAKAHPVSSAVITIGGLAAAAAAFWAVNHYERIAKARDAVGI